MLELYSNVNQPSRSPRTNRLFPLLLASLLTPVVASAQVTFNGVPGQQSVSLGSHTIGRSTTVALPFTIGSSMSTTVGSIDVLTTGVADLDFRKAGAATSCEATTYAVATHCVVNVTFKPLAAGARLGAVVFHLGSSKTSTVLASVFVDGIGKGAQLAFGSGIKGIREGGKFISPGGVAVDAIDDVFVTDLDDQEVFKITPKGKRSRIGSGYSVPQAVAVDGAGNVYVADSQAAQVYKVTPGGVQTTVGTGFDFPNGIAVDGSGNLYVTDPFIGQVVKITPGGIQSMVGSGYNTPAGVAVDAAGNVYVADTYNEEVFKITPGGAQTSVGTGLISPAAVAVDAAGDVYITDDGTSDVIKVTPSGKQTKEITDLNVPNGIAVDELGNLFVADTYSSIVLKFNRFDAPYLHFDTTKVGSKSSDSPKTVRIESIGNKALSFSALSYPADFREGESDDSCTSSTSLASSDSCALPIDFKPERSLDGKKSDTLTEHVRLTTNAEGMTEKPQSIEVTGTEEAK